MNTSLRNELIYYRIFQKADEIEPSPMQEETQAALDLLNELQAQLEAVGSPFAIIFAFGTI